MKLQNISERLPVWLVRWLVTAGIILAGIIFFQAVSWRVESVPSTAQTARASFLSAAQLTATASVHTTAIATVQASDSSQISPTQGTATPAAIDPMTPLLGRRIGIDPGHGPREDIGAVLVDPDTGEIVLSEAEFNLDVALRLRDLLVARGASVMLTRESADTFTAPWPSDANGDGEAATSGDDLQERVDILNDFHAEVFLSIHANGGMSDPPGAQDLQVLYCGTSDCAFPTENKLLGQIVLDQLQLKLSAATGGEYGGELLTDLDADSSDPPLHLFILGPTNPPRHVRAVAMPGVLAESLYITSPEQATELNQSSVRQAIALAYADALQSYLTGND